MSNLIRLIDLPLRSDDRGDLVFAHIMEHIPFAVKRVFYIYNVKPGGNRGHHAHKKTHLALICLNGSTVIKLDDGKRKQKKELFKPHQALIIPPLIWHSMERFGDNTILLSLASRLYDEADYLRDYNDFLNYVARI